MRTPASVPLHSLELEVLGFSIPKSAEAEHKIRDIFATV